MYPRYLCSSRYDPHRQRHDLQRNLAVGALVGIIINAILPGNDYEFGKDPLGDTSVNFQQGVDRPTNKKNGKK